MSKITFENVDLSFAYLKTKSIKNFLFRVKDARDDLREIRALRDISFELRDGDRLGIIGHNGAGKSVLLKTMAQIYTPTSGKVILEGRPTCLFELATGFEMEATGLVNIRLRAMMLGLSLDEINRKTEEIAEFSGLGEHLLRPVKYYSSGMFLRLAFSVSTAISPDILLLDEVVAAGDAGFIEKATQRMNEMVMNVSILAFVSHSMAQIRSFCNRCLWLSGGKIVMLDDVDTVIKAYETATHLNPMNPSDTLHQP